MPDNKKQEVHNGNLRESKSSSLPENLTTLITLHDMNALEIRERLPQRIRQSRDRRGGRGIGASAGPLQADGFDSRIR